MDREDSIEELISELSSEQAKVIDSLIGRKIWNIEILEDKDESAIKIYFSDMEGDYMLIHGENMDMYVINPKPDVTH